VAQAVIENPILVPYTLNDEEQNYCPDFLARFRRPDSSIVNLIVEVTDP
jgi:hypothetical protein